MSRVIAFLLALGVCVASTAAAKKSLLVDLSKSTVYAFEDGRMVRALTINPGAPGTPTRTGHFRITQKVRKGYRSNLVNIHNRPLKKGELGAPMDYWQRLGGTGMGFHRSSLWRPSGRWGSHGCLRMSRAGARWLFDWAPMGTPVEVVSRSAEVASASSLRSHHGVLAASRSRKRTIMASSGMPDSEREARGSASGRESGRSSSSREARREARRPGSGREARGSNAQVAAARSGSARKPAVAAAKAGSTQKPAVASAQGKPSNPKPVVASASRKPAPAPRPASAPNPASPPAVAAGTEKAPPAHPAGSEPSLSPIRTVPDEPIQGPARKKG